MTTTVICVALGVVILDYSAADGGWVAHPPGNLLPLARFDDAPPARALPAPPPPVFDGDDAVPPAPYDGDDAQARPARPAPRRSSSPEDRTMPLERVVAQALRGVLRATGGR